MYIQLTKYILSLLVFIFCVWKIVSITVIYDLIDIFIGIVLLLMIQFLDEEKDNDKNREII